MNASLLDGASPSLAMSYRSDSLVCVEAESLAVAVWSNTPSVEDVRAIIDQAERGKSAFAGRTLFINAVLGRRVGAGAVRPEFSSDVRRELMAFAKRDDLHTLATAHLVLADGFVGAAVRTFLNTIRLVARPPTPMQVFSDLASTAQWISQCATNEAWTPEAVAETFEHARAQR